jgi:hypothetical protein
MKVLFSIVYILAFGFIAQADASEVWVDAIFGDDLLGDGTQGAPFQTITKGVQSLDSLPGPTTVHVAPGMYGPTLGENFPIHFKTSMSIIGAGVTRTFVSGEGDGILFRLNPQTMISDMTLMRADRAIESLGYGTNIRYIRRCVFRNNGLGLYCEDSIHSDTGCVLVNSVMVGNDIGVQAHSTDVDFQSVSVLLYGCTVAGNNIALKATGLYEKYLGLFDSIVRGNGNDEITNWTLIYPGITGNVLGDPDYVGSNGNIDVDPELAAQGLIDMHLITTSPVVDHPAPPVVWPPIPMWVYPSDWIWESTFEEIVEIDGDERKQGDAIDPGADELLLPTLYLLDRTKLGLTFVLGTQADPFETVPIYFATSLYPSPLMGFLWLELPIYSLVTLKMNASGVAGLSILLPTDPVLEGLDLYFQAFRKKSGPWEGTAPVWIRIMP